MSSCSHRATTEKSSNFCHTCKVCKEKIKEIENECDECTSVSTTSSNLTCTTEHQNVVVFTCDEKPLSQEDINKIYWKSVPSIQRLLFDDALFYTLQTIYDIYKFYEKEAKTSNKFANNRKLDKKENDTNSNMSNKKRSAMKDYLKQAETCPCCCSEILKIQNQFDNYKSRKKNNKQTNESLTNRSTQYDSQYCNDNRKDSTTPKQSYRKATKSTDDCDCFENNNSSLNKQNNDSKPCSYYKQNSNLNEEPSYEIRQTNLCDYNDLFVNQSNSKCSRKQANRISEENLSNTSIKFTPKTKSHNNEEDSRSYYSREPSRNTKDTQSYRKSNTTPVFEIHDSELASGSKNIQPKVSIEQESSRNSKHSRTYGINDDANCYMSANPRKIRYALTRVKEYGQYTSYEVLNAPLPEPAKPIQAKAEGLFIIKNKGSFSI